MRRIDRYILSEMVVPALVGGVLVLLLLVGNQLYMLLRFLYQGVPARDVLLTLLYYTPGVLMMAIPAALLLGTALGLNRLERDREILALRMTGLRLKRIVLPIIILGALGSLGMFLLQEHVIPRTTHEAVKLSQKLAFGYTTAIVQRDMVFKAGNDFFIYVREVDPDPNKQMLHGIMVVKVNPKGNPTWLTIPVAENRDGQWLFYPDPVTKEPPRLYIFPRNGDPIIGEVAGHESVFNLPKDIFNYVYNPPTSAEELTFHELLALRNGVRGTAGLSLNNSLMLDSPHLAFYLHRKLAAPLAALVAILLAIPLSIHFGRSGGYVGLLLSVVLAFCFIVTQQWTQILAETYRLHPVFAAWAPDALYGILGLVLLVREE